MKTMKTLFTLSIPFIILAGIFYYMFLRPLPPMSELSPSSFDASYKGAPLPSDPTQLFAVADATSTGTAAPSREIPAGMKEFRSAPIHFSILYPQEMSVQVYREAGNAFTASFIDTKNEREFEVFATPYNGQQISKERFKMDEPSGVFKEPHDTTVDSVRATQFFGHNDTVGDTREIWFIKDGYLYEVMTEKALDPWLAPIMSTWKFI